MLAKNAETLKPVGNVHRANKAEAAVFFRIELATVNRWISRGMPVIQAGSRGVPWSIDLLEAARWRFGSLAPNDDGTTVDPEVLEPRARKDWYEGEKVRVALAVQNGDLVTVDEYRDELAGILKEVAATLETLPDVLERKCPMDGHTIIELQTILDRERAALALKLADAGELDAADGQDG